jgi:membrane protein implicated in regulation of membrane protease activity
MAESTIWWLLTVAAVAVELVTGTFYLLMLAIGLAAAAQWPAGTSNAAGVPARARGVGQPGVNLDIGPA